MSSGLARITLTHRARGGAWRPSSSACKAPQPRLPPRLRSPRSASVPRSPSPARSPRAALTSAPPSPKSSASPPTPTPAGSHPAPLPWPSPPSYGRWPTGWRRNARSVTARGTACARAWPLAWLLRGSILHTAVAWRGLSSAQTGSAGTAVTPSFVLLRGLRGKNCRGNTHVGGAHWP